MVETASLAEVVPPDFTYKHGLQKQVSEGSISSLQLESVIYAFEKVSQSCHSSMLLLLDFQLPHLHHY